ncbi:hypothetical protein [Yoonia sp.]|uniref:hypothetical protein n=1 Tax=Yoonia sp. TaxID=2212373 RepID=UPI0019F876A0|nr:hypothetical protein [Yoonia sp.]MBE0412204.1 hypothetical protein [Yoonia sp.]
MRPALLMIPLLALAACATPREACINDALRELRVLDRLIIETRANIARGYALEERQDLRTIRRTCTGTTAEGATFKYRCDKVDTFTRTVPAAIDLNAEQAKLQSLLQRQAQNRAQADQTIAQCIAVHPE